MVKTNVNFWSKQLQYNAHLRLHKKWYKWCPAIPERVTIISSDSEMVLCESTLTHNVHCAVETWWQDQPTFFRKAKSHSWKQCIMQGDGESLALCNMKLCNKSTIFSWSAPTVTVPHNPRLSLYFHQYLLSPRALPLSFQQQQIQDVVSASYTDCTICNFENAIKYIIMLDYWTPNLLLTRFHNYLL